MSFQQPELIFPKHFQNIFVINTLYNIITRRGTVKKKSQQGGEQVSDTEHIRINGVIYYETLKAYQRIEANASGNTEELKNAFVEEFLMRGDETLEEAKKRLAEEARQISDFDE